MLTRAHTLAKDTPGIDQLEKNELVNAVNGVISWTERLKDENTIRNRAEYAAAKEALADTVRRIWPRYYPRDPLPEDYSPANEHWFPSKTAAHEWYLAKGGIKKYCQFTKLIFWDGKKISREAVRELLDKEREKRRGEKPRVPVDLAARLELAETEKAEADAKKAQLQVEVLERQKSRGWIPRDVVYEREGAIVGRLVSDLRHHFGRAVPLLAAACGGDTQRLTELRAAAEQVIFAVFREFYSGGAIGIEYQPGDDPDLDDDLTEEVMA